MSENQSPNIISEIGENNSTNYSKEENIQYALIIVGAGAGGAALARNLEKQNIPAEILLIEAGEEYPPKKSDYKKPQQWIAACKDNKNHWSDVETKGLIIEDGKYKPKQWAIKRAKVGGGCSSHNAMVFVTGSYESNIKNIDAFKEFSQVKLKELYQTIIKECLNNNVRTLNIDWKDPFYIAFKNTKKNYATIIDSLDDYLVFEEKGIEELELDYRFLLNSDYERITAYQPNGLNEIHEFKNIKVKSNTECTKIEKINNHWNINNGEYFTEKIALCGGVFCTPIIHPLDPYPETVKYYDDLFLTFTMDIQAKHLNNLISESLPIRPEGWFFKSKEDQLDCSLQLYVKPTEDSVNYLQRIINFMGDQESIEYYKRKIELIQTEKLKIVDAWLIINGINFECSVYKKIEKGRTKYGPSDQIPFEIDEQINNAIEKCKTRLRSVCEILREDDDKSIEPYLSMLYEKNNYAFNQPNHCCGSVVNQGPFDPNLIIADSSAISKPCTGYIHAPTIALGWHCGDLLGNHLKK